MLILSAPWYFHQNTDTLGPNDGMRWNLYFIHYKNLFFLCRLYIFTYINIKHIYVYRYKAYNTSFLYLSHGFVSSHRCVHNPSESIDLNGHNLSYSKSNTTVIVHYQTFWYCPINTLYATKYQDYLIKIFLIIFIRCMRNQEGILL